MMKQLVSRKRFTKKEMETLRLRNETFERRTPRRGTLTFLVVHFVFVERLIRGRRSVGGSVPGVVVTPAAVITVFVVVAVIAILVVIRRGRR